jgi:hypothetical protein
MRKSITLLLISFLLLISGVAQTVSRLEGSPFPGTTKPDTLYYTGKSMTDSEVFATGSLSGILARTKPMIIQWQYFHQEIVREANLGIRIIDSYSNNFSGLLGLFSKRLDGYILCEPKSASSNVAATLSGILNAVAIPSDIEQKAIGAGLTKILDVRGKDEAWLLDNYGDRINKNFAFFQSLGSWLGLVDYTAYTGGIRYYDPQINGALALRVYDFLNPGATFFGWWVTEDGSVGKISQKSFKMIPSDGLKNLATLTNVDVPIVKQKEPVTPFKVVPNVHTVCFVISDGDHIGWVVGAGYWDSWIWKNDNQSRLKLGFTLSPALAELTPLIYNDIINGLQTTPEGRNVAVAAPSGVGYYFPSASPNNSFHCEQLNKFMRKADMSIVNVIDTDNGAHDPTEYLKQSNIDALFYYTYGSQYTGMKGKISWYKGKPSIGGRFTFWGNSSDRSAETQEKVAQTLANILNNQSTNIYAEAGYSLIPVHIWTENPHDVLNLVKKLGPNVRVVAPDEFVWLIRKNIGLLPVGDGFGLKAEYFNGNDFELLRQTRIDKKVDFEWGAKSPVTGVTTDNFSVRWSGQVQPLYSEEYTFYVTSDDGAKLTINGQTLTDALNATGYDVRSGKITLTAGEKYDIIVEYKEQTGNATCILEWESATQIRQVVPFTQLYSTPLSTTGLVTAYKENNLSGFSAGMRIGNYNSAQLAALGMGPDEISSIKVMEGFQAILYSGDNFTGDSLVVTASKNTLADIMMANSAQSWERKAVSMRVKANGVTNISGAFFLKNRLSLYNMNVGGSITDTGYNVNVNQYSANQANNQVFQFQHLGDGVYKIMARHSKMVLTVAKMGFQEAANVHQWKYHGSDSQEFIVVPTDQPNTYKLISKYSGMVINVGTSSISGNVQMNSNVNQHSAMWTFIETKNREGSGDGLKGDYFVGMAFNTFGFSRVDPEVYFKWGESTPGAPLGVNNFSVRWTGYIQPRYSGTYTFHITSDNGRRLWIDDKLIIDKWISDWDITYTGTVELTEMKKHKIKLEYFEEVGGANIRFEWSSNLETKEIVPQSQLYSQEEPNELPEITEIGIHPYPNPVRDRLYFGQAEQPLQFEIFNSQGVKVDQNKGTYAETAHLPVGLYLLNLNVEGEKYSFKFLKRD